MEAGVEYSNKSKESIKMEDDRLFLEGMWYIKPVLNTEGEILDDEQEDDLPGVYTRTNLQSEYRRVVLDKEFWQGIINHAHSCSHISTKEDGEQWRGPHPKDKLWEIGCQV